MDNQPNTSLTGCEFGALVAQALRGAWRDTVDPTNFSAQHISAITPLLYSSGSAALAWWRVRDSAAAESAAGARLHDAYRQMRLAALVHEREIKYALSLLRAVDIEPVLVKGWAIARHYPDRALRPYGDIDLCMRPDQFAKAVAALKCLETIEGHHVDLHAGFDNIGVDMSRVRQTSVWRDPWRSARLRRQRQTKGLSDNWDDLFERSQLVPLSEPGADRGFQAGSPLGVVDATGLSPVRVLSSEDHLRILCLHLLRSGAWRPLWLCDVALLVESRGSDFDWHRCLGRDPLYADWVACTIGLAHQLLGAEVKDTPVAARAQNLPRWLVPAVLSQWGRAHIQSPTSNVQGHVSTRRRWTLDTGLWTGFRDLYARWDNPVRATAAVGGQFNNLPRLPYRLVESIMRSPELPKQLIRMVRHPGFKPASSLQPVVSESRS